MQYANSDAGVQGFLFDGLFDRRLAYEFTAEQLTANAGLGPFAAFDRWHGLTQAVAGGLGDTRDTDHTTHGLLDILQQRTYGLLAGYEDANDAAQLRHDLTFQALLDHSADAPLASQSTLSRFENAYKPSALLRAGHALADRILDVLATHHGSTRCVTIDLDPTDDPTHGQQHFSFYHGHYRTHCLLPLLAFVTFHDAHGRERKESFLVGALLRHGKAHPTLSALSVLKRLIRKIRRRFARAQIRVRLDGGFATPKMFDGLDRLGVQYVVNYGKNPVLTAEAQGLLDEARAEALATGRSAKRYGLIWHKASTWSCQRLVMVKAEVTIDPQEPQRGLRDNPRFVVTNIYRRTPKYVYERIYCARGRCENRIKELKLDGALGRGSCTRFLANQLRLLIVHLAYAIIQLIRLTLADTPVGSWQYGRLRLALIKQPAMVRRSTRRTVFRLPRDGPHVQLLSDIGQRLASLLN